MLLRSARVSAIMYHGAGYTADAGRGGVASTSPVAQRHTRSVSVFRLRDAQASMHIQAWKWLYQTPPNRIGLALCSLVPAMAPYLSDGCHVTCLRDRSTMTPCPGCIGSGRS